MWNLVKLRLRQSLQRLVKSIAFYPAAIGIGFLVLSYLTITFDFSPAGKQIKSQLSWLSLRDASTARSIISAIVSGIISLTVFSFSMVMIVLNQAASQMSNRVLDKLIGNRFQQLVLGTYIGTIVYALFLLSTIRDIDSGIYVPALSTYLLIVLTVFDIFLFIYFLHYITQSVKYEVIIQRIYDATKESLQRRCHLKHPPENGGQPYLSVHMIARQSGVFEGVDTGSLLKLCEQHQCILAVTVAPGSFVLSGSRIVSSDKTLPNAVIQELMSYVRISKAESIEGNYFYGFRQLMEVALKALSPGINDPDTAVISLRALFQLYLHRLTIYPQTEFHTGNGEPRLFTTELGFELIFAETLLPVWDYGKGDRIIRAEFQRLLVQALFLHPCASFTAMLMKVDKAIAGKKS